MIEIDDVAMSLAAGDAMNWEKMQDGSHSASNNRDRNNLLTKAHFRNKARDMLDRVTDRLFRAGNEGQYHGHPVDILTQHEAEYFATEALHEAFVITRQLDAERTKPIASR